MLDLDKARTDRIAARASAAGSEGSGVVLPIRWRGETVTELPPELPLAALAPLKRIDSEIALLIGSALSAAKADGEGVLDVASLLVDLITGNQSLPQDLLSVAEDIAVAVLGRDGLDRFLAGAPSPQDVLALLRGALSWWGITLGEASRSSGSSPSGGPTSNAISSASTTSTSEASGGDPGIPDSSASAGSSS